MNVESILNIIGNDTRRRILSLIADEPHYISQIAKKLDITQPAIIRHIQILEDKGLIESYAVKSPFGAPRKYYKIIHSLNLVIALNPNTFKIMEQPRQTECKRYLEKANLIEEFTSRINSVDEIELKASIAVEVIDAVDDLLSCEDFDESNLNCISCRKIANLRKNVSQIILDVSRGDITSGLKILNDTMGRLFHIR